MEPGIIAQRKLLREKTVNLIRENKISTTEVADVLGKTGALKNILPLNSRHFIVGEVVFTYAFNESNWELHEQIAEADMKGKIVYIHAIDCSDRAIIGDLVSKYLYLYKHCLAIVVNAPMRDAHTLIKENYPIWCVGTSPVGCWNKKNTTAPDEATLNALKNKFNNGILICDDTGVVLIEDDKINDELIEKLNFIELQEDIWFFCMDTLKMSTYEIVCEKQYLTSELVDKERLLKLSKFQTAK